MSTKKKERKERKVDKLKEEMGDIKRGERNEIRKEGWARRESW